MPKPSELLLSVDYSPTCRKTGRTIFNALRLEHDSNQSYRQSNALARRAGVRLSSAVSDAVLGQVMAETRARHANPSLPTGALISEDAFAIYRHRRWMRIVLRASRRRMLMALFSSQIAALALPGSPLFFRLLAALPSAISTFGPSVSVLVGTFLSGYLLASQTNDPERVVPPSPVHRIEKEYVVVEMPALHYITIKTVEIEVVKYVKLRGEPDTLAEGGPDTLAEGGPDTLAEGVADTLAEGGPDTLAEGGPDAFAADPNQGVAGSGVSETGTPNSLRAGGATQQRLWPAGDTRGLHPINVATGHVGGPSSTAMRVPTNVPTKEPTAPQVATGSVSPQAFGTLSHASPATGSDLQPIEVAPHQEAYDPTVPPTPTTQVCYEVPVE